MTRGLIRGRWYRDVSAAPTWREDAERFRHGGFSHAIDRQALAAEPQRFHLYVSWACPFAHRVILARALLGLEAELGMSVVHPWLGGADGWFFSARKPPDGWFFSTELENELYDGLTRDQVGDLHSLHEVYARADPDFVGRVTVPVLWDLGTDSILSNESATIMSALIDAFGGRNGRPDLRPDACRDETDRISGFVRDRINAGAYRAGAARTQRDYERHADTFFDALAEMNSALSRRPYLVGDGVTEPDLLLFTTLVRLDPAYAGVLYLTQRRLDDFAGLAAFVERLSANPVIGKTVKTDQIRRHYFDDDAFINRRVLQDGRYAIPQPVKANPDRAESCARDRTTSVQESGR